MIIIIQKAFLNFVCHQIYFNNNIYVWRLIAKHAHLHFLPWMKEFWIKNALLNDIRRWTMNEERLDESLCIRQSKILRKPMNTYIHTFIESNSITSIDVTTSGSLYIIYNMLMFIVQYYIILANNYCFRYWSYTIYNIYNIGK